MYQMSRVALCMRVGLEFALTDHKIPACTSRSFAYIQLNVV